MEWKIWLLPIVLINADITWKTYQEVTGSVAVMQMAVSSVISFHYALEEGYKTLAVSQLRALEGERLCRKMGTLSWNSYSAICCADPSLMSSKTQRGFVEHQSVADIWNRVVWPSLMGWQGRSQVGWRCQNL